MEEVHATSDRSVNLHQSDHLFACLTRSGGLACEMCSARHRTSMIGRSVRVTVIHLDSVWVQLGQDYVTVSKRNIVLQTAFFISQNTWFCTIITHPKWLYSTYNMPYAKPGVNWIKNDQDIWGDRQAGPDCPDSTTLIDPNRIAVFVLTHARTAAFSKLRFKITWNGILCFRVNRFAGYLWWDPQVLSAVSIVQLPLVSLRIL